MQPFEALTRQRFRVPSSSWLVCADRTMLTETREIIIAKVTSLIIASCWRSNLTPYCSDPLENKERDRNTQDVVTSVRNIVCWSLSGLKAGAANAVWRAGLINRLALPADKTRRSAESASDLAKRLRDDVQNARSNLRSAPTVGRMAPTLKLPMPKPATKHHDDDMVSLSSYQSGDPFSPAKKQMQQQLLLQQQNQSSTKSLNSSNFTSYANSRPRTASSGQGSNF
jgi:hypothetical protein